MIDALVLWTSGTLTTTCTWRMWEVVNKDTKCYRCGGWWSHGDALCDAQGGMVKVRI